MQVRELVELAKFLRSFIQEKELLNRYTNLTNAVNEAAKGQNPQNVPVALAALRQLHSEAEQQILSPAQAKLMRDYKADKVFGKTALQRIDEIFATNQGHPQGITSGLDGLRAETKTLVNNANQLITVLQPLLEGTEEADPELLPGEGRLWLYFEQAASVETIDDLEEAAETWRKILHNFSRLPNATTAGGRILQIHKHSPLELEIGALLTILAPLAYGIHWFLKRFEHVVRILQQVEILKQLEAKTDAVDILLAQAAEMRRDLVANASEEVSQKYKADPETTVAIRQALGQVLDFIQKGGQLDIDAKSNADTDDVEGEPAADPDHASLRALIQDLRKELKSLPKPPAPPEGPTAP